MHGRGGSVAVRWRSKTLEGKLRLVGDDPQHGISLGGMRVGRAAGQDEEVADIPGKANEAANGIARSARTDEHIGHGRRTLRP
jgi:hypothetical protein